MVDVLTTEMSRESLQQILLLERRVRRDQHAERVSFIGGTLSERIANGLDGLCPLDFDPLLLPLDQWSR
jgi:hypothetical protein